MEAATSGGRQSSNGDMVPGRADPTAVLTSQFPPIADYALLSDCAVTALVAPSGNIEWLCLPRIDSPSVFGAMLDRGAGGFRLGPADLLVPAARRYVPGTMVLETINPQCWFAFFSSYIRDLTHVRPVHPETLQYLLRASGFERVEIRYRTPLPDTEKLKVVELSDDFRRSEDASSAAVIRLADACNANATRLNTLMFSYMDYAVIGYRS